MGSDNNDEFYATKERAIRARVKDAMRKWREFRGFSQGDMAACLGVTKGNYQKYEYDDRGVPVAVIAQFCLIADVDPTWLLLGRKDKK